MRNPYFIGEWPAVISVSGGRTSGYMLHKILEAHDGVLPDETVVVFCNTGMEHPATLDFVQAMSDNWEVQIFWLEYTTRGGGEKVVQWHNASRNGEPFAKMIADRNFLPNPMARFCTSDLKVLLIERFMEDSDGAATNFESYVGIRADEPRRAAKMKLKDGYHTPLFDNGVTEHDIRAFWEGNDFDLALPPAGDNQLSNCTLCFLKGYKTKQSIVSQNPEYADWWIAQEELVGGRFRSDQPSYAQMKVIATDQPSLFEGADDETMSCFCGD